MADNPLLPFVDAARIEADKSQWLLWLAGIEVVRQLHFFISERWSGYHRFWSQRVFGGTERALRRRFSDWTRFRLARVLKWLAFIVLLALVLGKVLDTSPVLALFQAPALIFAALPLILQLLFAFFFIAFQFIGLFWLLSRGGVDTYYPDDITTRFADVWGQDHVVERVKENIVFLENPDAIEAKGGYVPSGPAAVGAARHRQDADGRGGGRGDRQAVRVRRPRRVHQHVHGHRDPQGQVAVPEAAQAGAALRRRDRVLRRGRRAGQPRADAGRWAGHAGRARDGPVRAVPDGRLPRLLLPERGHPVAAAALGA